MQVQAGREQRNRLDSTMEANPPNRACASQLPIARGPRIWLG